METCVHGLAITNAIVTADTLSDFGGGLDVWLGGRKHVMRDDVLERLRPLLELPVELVRSTPEDEIVVLATRVRLDPERPCSATVKVSFRDLAVG